MKIGSKDPGVRSKKSFWLLCAGLWLLFSCTGKPMGSENATSSTNSTKFQQYYVQGEQLYLTQCSNCHQENGKGLGLLFPPLNQSDFVDTNLDKVICIMKHGISGELIV